METIKYTTELNLTERFSEEINEHIHDHIKNISEMDYECDFGKTYTAEQIIEYTNNKDYQVIVDGINNKILLKNKVFETPELLCKYNLSNIKRVHGRVVLYTYEDIYEIYNYVNGIKHGEYKSYSIGTKKLTMECIYHNGMPHGNWKTYNTDGTLKGELEHYHGKLHGISKMYNNEGQMIKQEEYYHGLKHGTWLSFYETGSVKAVQTFEYGIYKSSIGYNSDGTRL